MKPRRSIARLLPLALVLALPAAGSAQGRVRVVVEDGGKPAPGVDVYALLDDGKPVLQTSADGDGVAFDPSILDMGKGVDTDGDGLVSVEVHRKACVDGRVEVILAVEGARNGECADPNASPGEGCTCRKIGAFVPVPGGEVTIDVGQGVANAVRARPPAELGSNWNLGAVASYQHYGNWEDVAKDAAARDPSIAGVEAGSNGFSAGAFLEYGRRDWPLVVGIQGTFGKAPDVDYALVGGGSATGSTKVGEITPYVAVPFEAGPLDLALSAGSSWLCNKFDVDFGDGDSFDRMEHNWNPFARLEVGVPVSDRLRALLGASYSTNFSGNDADSDVFGLSARLSYSIREEY